MTRRYIGEYRSKTDLLYRQTISLDSGLLDVEIVDVSAETDNEFPIEQIQWADSCLIVYSITDRERYVEQKFKSLLEIKIEIIVYFSYIWMCEDSITLKNKIIILWFSFSWFLFFIWSVLNMQHVHWAI